MPSQGSFDSQPVEAQERQSYEMKLARLMNAAERVVKEAESVHYMGRMECSVEAIHGLQAALKLLGLGTHNDGLGPVIEGEHG